MKSRNWRVLVALAAFALVPLIATQAMAAPDFTAAPTEGNLWLDVTFTPVDVTGTPDSTTWDFGDGATLSEGSGLPSGGVHTYTTSGQFDVTMIVWYTASDDSVVTKLDEITVSPIDFTGDPLIGTVPLTTTFTPANLGTPDSVVWDFGDGDTFSDDTAPFGNVVHSYNTGPATYTVAMTAWYPGDLDSTVTKTDYVETVEPQIVMTDTAKGSCGGVADTTLPDTVSFTYFAPPGTDSLWWEVRWVDTLAGTLYDSTLVTGGVYDFDYVFTFHDTFMVTVYPYTDSLWTNAVDSVEYISSECWCVKAVNDGYTVAENDTLKEMALDNDTLGVFLDPQPVDTAFVLYDLVDTTRADTTYFDRDTTTGLWWFYYIPKTGWHGKDTVSYEVSVQGGCSAPDTATVFITVKSDGIVGIEALEYFSDGPCVGCGDPATISLGDTLQIWVRINPVDVQEIASGWPKVWFPALGGAAGGEVMFLDTIGVMGDDSTWYSIPFQDTAGAYPDWRTIMGGNVEASPGFTEIWAQIVSDSGLSSYDTTTIVERVDTRMPDAVGNDSIAVSLWGDVDGNDIINVNDTLRFFIDLRNNPINDATYLGGSKEICGVTATIFGWTETAGLPDTIVLTLQDDANDNRFFVDTLVQDIIDANGVGVLDSLLSAGGDLDVVFEVTDNACNVDSVWTTVSGADRIDIVAPIFANIFFEYRQPPYGSHGDVDSNGCLRAGDYVQLRVYVPSGSDVDSVYADFLDSGLGGETPATSWKVDLQKDNASDTVWYVVWRLQGSDLDSIFNPRTQDSSVAAIDLSGPLCDSSLTVHVTAADEAGNRVFANSMPLDYCVDTKIPFSIPEDSISCARYPVPGDNTFDVLELTWTYNDPDAAFFEIHWNDDNGNPIITDTVLAAQFDTLMVWRSDSTVHPVSPCRDYDFQIVTVDDCYNRDYNPATFTCFGEDVGTVAMVDCVQDSCGGVQVRWDPEGAFGAYEVWWNRGTFGNPSVKLATISDGMDTVFSTWDGERNAPNTTIDDAQLAALVPLVPGDNYRFTVKGIDTCQADDVAWADTLTGCEIAPPAPVNTFTCTSIDSGHIQLDWRSNATAREWFLIYMGKDGEIDFTEPIDSVEVTTLSGGNQQFSWTTMDAGLTTGAPNSGADLVDRGWYDFTIYTRDACGFLEEEHPDTVQCLSDLAPPHACIIQPEPGDLHCVGNELLVYVCALDPEVDDDIVSVTVKGRVVGATTWTTLGSASQANQEICFDVALNANTLNALVGADTTRTIELIVTPTDLAGKTLSNDSAYVTCPSFTFDWSTEVLDAQIVSVNGDVRTYQDFCDLHGYDVFGPDNELILLVEDGEAPYKVQVTIDGVDVYYTESSNGLDTVNIDMTGFGKGAHELAVQWWDLCGRAASDLDSLCVPDSLGPCAEITNPVDGKCIRKSRSMQDPVPVTLTIDPDENCIDPDDVFKVDFEWGEECCIGEITKDSSFFRWELCQTDTTDTSSGLVCDTFPDGAMDFDIDSIICVDTSATCSIQVRIDTTFTVPCDEVWHTFAIEPGSAIQDGQVTTDWFNRHVIDSLGLGDGDIIYLRARVYDDQENITLTPCVAVCIDTTTPPLVLWSPDVCYGDGKEKLSGEVDFIAHLDITQDVFDDIEDVTLWYKLSSDPDQLNYWTSVGSGFFDVQGAGTRETGWRWDDFDTDNLTQLVYYDFRVIAKTIWGTYSYDYDGDFDFDAGTFDTTNGDAASFFIDNEAPGIAIDTVWTEIDDQVLGVTETVIQPNTSCRLSDPRGWAFMQFGKTIEVQPSVYPFAEADDVAKIEWRLWDGECSGCACEGDPALGAASVQGDCDSKVLSVREGEGVLDHVTLDPSIAPFVTVQDGFQVHTLTVTITDSCGNTSTDCISLYMLDVTPSEAVIIEPMNDEVFCQDHEQDGGGIEIVAAGLLANQMQKVSFYYRAEGATEWTLIETVEVPSEVEKGILENISALWYPHALGLDDGTYELLALATDYSLNEQTTEYITRVHLSCGEPTVTMVNPETVEPEFEFLDNCGIELSAEAVPSDPYNTIEEVCFYYTEWTENEANQIGCDNYSTGNLYHFNWDPSEDLSADGKYYIWATATNKAGVTVASEKVLVQYDGTDPWTEVIEVAGDGSNGGSADPTTVTAGDMVDIYALGRDNESPLGYGDLDNCGVDSVKVFVYNSSNEKIFGELMVVDPSIDSLYMATWPTSGLPNGTYRVWTEVTDCACNDDTSPYWYVRVINPTNLGTIAINEAIEVCDTLSINADSVNINFTEGGEVDVSNVVIWWAPMSSSDVYDQYSRPTPNNGALQDNNNDGVWEPIVDFGTAGLAEGVYRVRAVVTSSQGVVSDDYDDDGLFDDFTFNVTNSHHMIVKVDRSVTPFTVDLDAYTIQAGTDVTVTVTPEDACDVDEVCYGLVAQNGNSAVDTCIGDLEWTFDPADSGLVSLKHGIWYGPVTVEVTDPLGNVETWVDEMNLYVLDIEDNEAMVVSPTWGDFISGDEVTVTARKLTSGTVSDLDFFFGGATGGGTQIEGDVTQSGDEFMVTWDLSEVDAGDYYLWTSAADDKRVPVTVVKVDADFALMEPIPNYKREVFNEELTFVGGRVDICVDTETEDSLLNRHLVDSVVFAYRFGDAPGVPFTPDPEEGWVIFGVDRYGSLCTDWFTDLDFDLGGCRDGHYSVVAWAFYKGGVANHSRVLDVMVDNTDPYSEITDIDGDETFGDCHEIIITGEQQEVKFSAVAVDDRSCAGDTPEFNSGAMTMQFFVGQCEGSFGGCVDIIWVIDGSGSMGDDQAQIASQAQNFFQGLGGLDFRMGVVGYTDGSNPVSTSGVFEQGGAGTGDFTTDLATFQTMVTAVGDTGSGTENGLTAINDALNWYSFRSNCAKAIILVTDEDADDIEDFNTLVPDILTSGAQISTVFNFGDSTGYSTLAPRTNGAQLDITSNWGANLTALASQISGGAGAGGDVGIIWGQQVDLTDGDQYPDNPFALWDPTGVPEGTYCAWTVVTDEVGNSFQSPFRSICIEDRTPPVGYVAGFGVTTDEHMNKEYYIMGRTWDEDVERVQFQWRQTSENDETDWTGIGLAQMVNGDSTCWMTTWNPCVWSGTQLEFRMVPTDKSGNQDFEAQPIFTGTVSNCEVTPSGPSATSEAEVAFEDKTFENLGLVHVNTTEISLHHSMLAFYADYDGGFQIEKVKLFQDQGTAGHMMGSFDDSQILGGGFGWFWVAYNDANGVTFLEQSRLTVYHVETDLGFPGCVTDESFNAQVCLDPGATPAENGVALFPARPPVLALTQQYIQVWGYDGAANNWVTAVRLTDPLEDGFEIGKYAKVTISYDSVAVADAGIEENQLAVGWWDGDEWNTVDDMIAGGEISGGTATFYTKNLHGLYAVVSTGRSCNSGALTVEHHSAYPYYSGYAGNRPVIKTLVRSNIHGDEGNYDIDPSMITVKIDGITVYSRGDNAEGWLSTWDNTSGILTTRPLASDNVDDFFQELGNLYNCFGGFGGSYDYWDFCYFDNADSSAFNCDDDAVGQSPDLCCRLMEYMRNYYDCVNGSPTYNRNYPVMALDCGPHTIEVQSFNRAGYCGSTTWDFEIDCTEPNIVVETGYACPNPTFTFDITDDASGVNWDSVYVDVYEYTPSWNDQEVRRARLLHTETPDALDEGIEGNTATFSLTFEQAQYDGFRIVIYNGNRTLVQNNECNCEYYVYNHNDNGVPDLVGNSTEIVEEFFTVDPVACDTGEYEGGDDIKPSQNPFDPFAGEVVTFPLNGFRAGGGTIHADVYDLTGEKVTSLSENFSAGGFQWDGRTAKGDMVAEGVYLVHFHKTGAAAGSRTSQAIKVVVKRAD